MEKLIHIDLFSGIGGFALAADTVWGRENVEHIFCDNDNFCQKVLKKHWPEAKIFGDIRTITADAIGIGHVHGESPIEPAKSDEQALGESIAGIPAPLILTGGFPCQPFSQAGRRKGTADDRWLWPEMFRVIRLTKPQWVIAENVRGFVTMQSGMVLEQVCLDLEGEGYTVQPFIIPAVAVNAPHRRDRVWIVATNSNRKRPHSGEPGWRGGRVCGQDGEIAKATQGRKKRLDGNSEVDTEDAQNTVSERSRGRDEGGGQVLERKSTETENARPDWEGNWLEVATELCGVDDGLPAELDGLKLSKPQHRVQRLKSLGNAIVPQVAIEIMRSIQRSNQAVPARCFDYFNESHDPQE